MKLLSLYNTFIVNYHHIFSFFFSLFWSSFLTKKVVLKMMLGRYQSRVELLCRRCYVSPNTRNAINKCHRRRATYVLKRSSSSRCENSSSDTNLSNKQDTRDNEKTVSRIHFCREEVKVRVQNSHDFQL